MGTKAKNDFAPNVRRAIYDGMLLAAKRKGQTLTEMAADWVDKDWQGALNALAKFAPRETTIKGKIDVQHHLPDSNTSKAWLEQQMQAIEGEVVREALEDKSED